MSPASVTAKIFLDPSLGFCLIPDNEPNMQAELNEEARSGKLKPKNVLFWPFAAYGFFGCAIGFDDMSENLVSDPFEEDM